MIALEHLTVRLNGQTVLNDLRALFPAGQVTGIIGPNGCGKTTLLRTLTGLQKAEIGRALLNGEDLFTMDRRERALHLAYLPQSRPVPQIRAGLLVEHGRFPHQGFSKHSDGHSRTVVREAMEQTGTLSLEQKLLPELSGGERQRVYIAAALAQETDVLLLDEPTTFLDLPHQLEVLELCRELSRRGKTVVLVLHDLQQAFTYADTVCVLHAGQAAACAPTGELLGSPLLKDIFGCHVLPAADGIYNCRLCR